MNSMNPLPSDPVMLLSVVNMKLRDIYPGLDALCDDLDVKRKDIEDALTGIGYSYDRAQNAFVPKE